MRSDAGSCADRKALGVAAGTVARPTTSSIQRPASSIGQFPAQEFETKTLAQTEIMCQPFQDFGLDKWQCPCK